MGDYPREERLPPRLHFQIDSQIGVEFRGPRRYSMAARFEHTAREIRHVFCCEPRPGIRYVRREDYPRLATLRDSEFHDPSVETAELEKRHRRTWVLGCPMCGRAPEIRYGEQDRDQFPSLVRAGLRCPRGHAMIWVTGNLGDTRTSERLLLALSREWNERAVVTHHKLEIPLDE